MKHVTKTIVGLFVLAVMMVPGTSAHAAMILGVDFQNNESETQAGFEAFSVSDDGESDASRSYLATGVASGEITFTINGGSMGRNYSDRAVNDGDFTQADLMGDLLTGFSSGATSNTQTLLTISGLDPNTAYTVQIWSIDPRWNDGRIYHWHDRTGGGDTTEIGTVTNQTGNPVNILDNDEFSVVGQLISDGNGNIEIGLSQSGSGGGSGALNGIAIVPEPASLALVSLGGLLMLRRHRQTSA